MSEIDIVIPTYNRPDALARCLEALCGQSIREFRVIVVDDASPTDLEGDFRSQFAEVLDIEWIRHSSNLGPARARNEGVAAGSAPLVCFIDDDVVASPGLLAAHRTALSGPDPRIVSIGPLRAPRDWKPSPWNRWEARTLAIEYARMMKGVYDPTWRQLFTGNAMMRREDFERVGGFDTRFKRAEDIELGYRLWKSQCDFVFSPFAIGWHYADRSLSSWMKIPGMYAEADYAMSLAYPELNWLQAIDAERAGVAGRVSESVAKMGVLGNGIRKGTVSVALGLDKLGVYSLATPILSMAFNIGYRQGRLGLHPNMALHESASEAVANR